MTTDTDHRASQLVRIKRLMSDGRWYTLREICDGIGGTSEAGASARLRQLDNECGITHDKRPRSGRLIEYRLNLFDASGQGQLFGEVA
jgi:hypothetical protein